MGKLKSDKRGGAGPIIIKPPGRTKAAKPAATVRKKKP